MSFGGVAQLVERYVRNVEARGSNPLISTKIRHVLSDASKRAPTHGVYLHVLSDF